VLESERLLEEAKDATGLDDYGDMGFAEGMGLLVKSINEEAGLTPEYEALLKQEFDRLLANRLRMQQDIRQHPEILEEEVLPPIFITSMPRTGSTKLHRMLAATGDFNALRYWHSLNFAPFPAADGAEPDPRIAAAYEHLNRIYEHAPDFQKAHPMYAEEAEEELALLDAGFNSLYRWAALLNVPSYIGFVLSSDPLAAFRDLRAMIQYLQWQHFGGLGRRWVFKTPSLFGFEAVYSMAFEGTDFIVTHRHPERTMASTCFLACGSRSLYSEQDFTGVISEMVLGNFGQALQGHLAWREAYPPEKVLDVRFEDIVNDEVGVSRRVYDFLGMEWTDRAEENLKAWIEMDSTRGHEPSKAKLETYGLEPEQINEAFGAYIERYSEFL
jgi:Sulfotransferase family